MAKAWSKEAAAIVVASIFFIFVSFDIAGRIYRRLCHNQGRKVFAVILVPRLACARPPRQSFMEPYRAASVVQMSIFRTMEIRMSKTDAVEIRKKTERQVENTSAGGHLGGTYFG